MNTNKYLYRDGFIWICLEVQREENARFYWHKIRAKWSWLGPPPNQYNEEKTFYTAHSSKEI